MFREGEGSRTAPHIPRVVIRAQALIPQDSECWAVNGALWVVLAFPSANVTVTQVRYPQRCTLRRYRVRENSCTIYIPTELVLFWRLWGPMHWTSSHQLQGDQEQYARATPWKSHSVWFELMALLADPRTDFRAQTTAGL